MAGQRPRKGWVYFINPHRVALRCGNGHKYIYNMTAPREMECKHKGCNSTVNPSRVFRGEHPYIVWINPKFHDTYGAVEVLTAIPLTTSEREKGLPTTYPVKPTRENGLTEDGYALVHQITTIDANCFKDKNGNWKRRTGQLGKHDKDMIEERLRYYLDISENPSDDWFLENANLNLLQKIFFLLPAEEREEAIESLINEIK